MKNRKKRFGCLAALLCCAACFGLLCFACRFRHFTSPEDFTAAGYKLPFPVPENAGDIRLAGRKLLFGQQHLCAFTLPEADANLFVQQYCSGSEDALRTAAEYAAECSAREPEADWAEQEKRRNIAEIRHNNTSIRGCSIIPLYN